MFKMINQFKLSRNLIKLNNQNKLIVNLINYSTKPNQKLKEDDTQQQQIYEGTSDEEIKKKRKIIEIDPFMLPIEFRNLTDEQRKEFEKFFEQPFYIRAYVFTKSFLSNLKFFILNELFFLNQIEGEKDVLDRNIDCIWEFKGEEDIKKWMILCDADFGRGYSTVQKSVNKQGRLLFHGFLDCDNLPKDGIHTHAGYVHLSSPYKKGGFNFEGYYNWGHFNHFIIRFKGDGRVYRILLRVCTFQQTQVDLFYEYFLYTRGGPYWQTAKIPFSKFLLCNQGRIVDSHRHLPAHQVQSFAITLTKYTGPFRLEISHIGLQLDYRNNQQFDYEGYFRPEFIK